MGLRCKSFSTFVSDVLTNVVLGSVMQKLRKPSWKQVEVESIRVRVLSIMHVRLALAPR